VRSSRGHEGLQPERLDGFGAGYRWGLWALPAPEMPSAGAVLVVQAFLDEQALSRRMLAHTARRLGEAGWTVLIVDTFGTGDSAGDHGEATLERWREDLLEAARRLRTRAPDGPLVLLGVRMGALLAIDLAGLLPDPPTGLVLWNAPAAGASLVDPLRRLARLGAAGAAGAADGGNASPARGARLAGWPVEGDLLDALRGLRLTEAPPCPPGGGMLALIQTQRATGDATRSPPALEQALDAWRQAGWRAELTRVAGEPWWSAMDPCDPRPLTDSTLAAVAQLAAVAAAPPAPLATVAAAARAAPRSGPTPSAAASPAPPEAKSVEVLSTAGAQGALAGVLTRGPTAPIAAVLIVPGQPQTRVGAHRMFVTLAASLGARDIASLRVDLAGWGDSDGQPGPFESGSADIVAAALALRARLPEAPLWLHGLCDGASALVLALPLLRQAGVRVQGLCLLNPWVRSEASLAGAMIDTYYRRRLLDPDLWQRLLRGQVPLRNLLVEPLRFLGRRLARTRTASRGHDGDRVRSLPHALIDALDGFGGEVLTVLAGADLTAAETEALLASELRWRARLDRPGCLLRLPGADHTLSDPSHEGRALDWLGTRIAEQAQRAQPHPTRSGAGFR
jgi:exosortase A-associated hydrolase 1/exosortase A-associated hydrolase 2